MAPKAPTSAALPSNDCALMRIFSLGPVCHPLGTSASGPGRCRMAPPMPRLSVGCSTRLAGGRPWRGRARARRCWPQVQEGAQGADHGVVVCRLCARHEKTNNFAEGYRRVPGPAVCKRLRPRHLLASAPLCSCLHAVERRVPARHGHHVLVPSLQTALRVRCAITGASPGTLLAALQTHAAVACRTARAESRPRGVAGGVSAPRLWRAAARPGRARKDPACVTQG